MQDFIFTQGIWLGEGTIALTSSPELIKFYTKWEIEPLINDLIKATQIIQMQGVKESTRNTLTFMNITQETFDVIIENQYFEQVIGKGLRTEHTLSWNFNQNSTFEGFESYKKLKNNELFLQAKYGCDQHRTLIEGILWQKSQ